MAQDFQQNLDKALGLTEGFGGGFNFPPGMRAHSARRRMLPMRCQNRECRAEFEAAVEGDFDGTFYVDESNLCPDCGWEGEEMAEGM